MTPLQESLYGALSFAIGWVLGYLHARSRSRTVAASPAPTESLTCASLASLILTALEDVLPNDHHEIGVSVDPTVFGPNREASLRADCTSQITRADREYRLTFEVRAFPSDAPEVIRAAVAREVADLTQGYR